MPNSPAGRSSWSCRAASRSFPSPVPPRWPQTFYTRYLRALGPLSLGYAALTAVLTRSLGRTFEALLLVNPRTAIIGMEAANLDAAARVLRGGVTVVGTRPDRAIRLPDVLLLDGPRVLTDGLEIATVLPLDEALDAPQVPGPGRGYVSAAAGSPWGGAFPARQDRGGGRELSTACGPRPRCRGCATPWARRKTRRPSARRSNAGTGAAIC